MTEGLRPIERRMLALSEQGMGTDEIARRFKRGQDHVERMMSWMDIPRAEVAPTPTRRLRPLESRVLDLRAQGVSYEEIARRFRRGPDHIRRVEQLAHLRSELGLV